MWGEVSCMDVFGDPHTMEFCGYRKGLTGGFLECAFHNQPDAQAINRDPSDAAGDAEVLCKILRLRATAVQQRLVPAEITAKSTKTIS